MSEEIISFIDFTVMSDEEKYKLLNIRDNRISSLKIVNEELEFQLQQKENLIKEAREDLDKQISFCTNEADGTTNDKYCRIAINYLNHLKEILDKEINKKQIN